MTGAVRYEIEHVSRYRYSAPVQRCVMLLCLKPLEDRGQRLLDFRIETEPASRPSPERDGFGNTRHVFDLHRGHETLWIRTRSVVEKTQPPTLPARLGAGAWEALHAARRAFADWDYTRPSALTRPCPALAAFTERHAIEPGDDPVASLPRPSEALHRTLRYTPGSTTAESPVEHVLETGEGVCQDYAHLMIAIARSWGVPARYVSGYLHLTDAPGEQTPSSATHAWVECRLPELGWVGFDPTNRSLAGNGHVRIATGRDYRDVSPTRGVIHGGGTSRVEVDVRIRAVAADVTGRTAIRSERHRSGAPRTPE